MNKVIALLEPNVARVLAELLSSYGSCTSNNEVAQQLNADEADVMDAKLAKLADYLRAEVSTAGSAMESLKALAPLLKQDKFIDRMTEGERADLAEGLQTLFA